MNFSFLNFSVETAFYPRSAAVTSSDFPRKELPHTAGKLSQQLSLCTYFLLMCFFQKD